MPQSPIPFGDKTWPSIDPVQLKDGIAQELIDGFIDPTTGCYVKRPGLIAFSDYSNNSTPEPIDGLYETFSGNVYTVYNSLLRRLASNGTPTTITGSNLAADVEPTWDETTGFVYLANGGKINKVDQAAGTASEVTTATAPSSVTHLCVVNSNLCSNGLASGGVAGDVNFSTDDGVTFRLFNNERIPDGCTALTKDKDELLAGGPRSFEWNWDDGTTPWAAVDGGYIQYGVVAPYSVVNFADTNFALMIMEGCARVVRTKNRSIEPLSTPYDTVIDGFTNHANAKGFGISYKGIPFYLLSFPSDGYTLAFNLANSTWSRWGRYNASAYECHRINCNQYVKGWRKQLIGDRIDAKIWQMGNYKDDAGEAIRFQLTSAPVTYGTDLKKRSNYDLFVFKRGDASDSSEPTVSIEVADDGKAWKTARTASLGVASATEYYIRLDRNGMFRTRQYRIVHADTKSSLILARSMQDYDLMMR